MSTTLKAGGTTTTAGGTTQTFEQTNTSVNNGKEYADVSVSNFFAREKVVLVSRMPAEQSDGSWSKQKLSARFVDPITLTDGSISFNIGRVEVEYHPETSAADVAKLREMCAQMAISAVYDAFYKAGTLPA